MIEKNIDAQIDLVDLVRVFWKEKVLIMITTFVIIILTLFYALSLPNLYTSSTLLKLSEGGDTGSLSSLASQYGGLASLAGISLPSGSNDKSDYVIETIESREFTSHLLQFNNLKPMLMAFESYNPLSKVINYDSEIYDIKSLDYLYSHKLKDYQIQTLIPLGLEKINIIDSQKYRHIESNEIICTDPISYYSGYFAEQSKYIPIWVVEWLRNTFLECSKKFTCNDKIFIDRSAAPTKHCQFINDKEISEFLIGKGFTKYKTENLNFFEEVYLFKNANYIIGAHGAGLTNLVFCKKGAKIIEIRPKNYNSAVYSKLSDINNLDYKLISTDTIQPQDQSNGDIKLDISLLKNL